jgi:hypothetical protein
MAPFLEQALLQLRMLRQLVGRPAEQTRGGVATGDDEIELNKASIASKATLE